MATAVSLTTTVARCQGQCRRHCRHKNAAAFAAYFAFDSGLSCRRHHRRIVVADKDDIADIKRHC